MKKNISKFLKNAYKNNKVKDLNEAFIEYPVEEEWHKGKIENVLKDVEVLYNDDYKIGDIVFVKNYLYSNGKEGNNHLFVIIDKDNRAVPVEYFGMLISSNLYKLKYDTNIFLTKNLKNNLNKNSIVKIDTIYKIEAKEILFRIGTVDKQKINLYKKMFYNNLKNK